MKWTPILSAVILGATATTALQPSGGADDAQPTGMVSMHGSHHGHDHSYTGSHHHMSSTFTMGYDEAQPTGATEQKRGNAKGGSHQSGGGDGQHTMMGGSHVPSGGPHPSGHGHHTGGGMNPSLTLSGDAPQQTGEGMMLRERAPHRGHGGGHHSNSVEHSTTTSVSQVHVPTTMTKMVTANGH